MSKTLGQVAYEAWRSAEENGIRWPWEKSVNQKLWEAAANAVIEECAKVAEADDSFMMLQDWGLQNAVTQKGENIATAIRSLKTSTGEETANE